MDTDYEENTKSTNFAQQVRQVIVKKHKVKKAEVILVKIQYCTLSEVCTDWGECRCAFGTVPEDRPIFIWPRQSGQCRCKWSACTSLFLQVDLLSLAASPLVVLSLTTSLSLFLLTHHFSFLLLLSAIFSQDSCSSSSYSGHVRIAFLSFR